VVHGVVTATKNELENIQMHARASSTSCSSRISIRQTVIPVGLDEPYYDVVAPTVNASPSQNLVDIL
jgi:hypothetical protein